MLNLLLVLLFFSSLHSNLASPSNSSEHESMVFRTLGATDGEGSDGIDRDNVDLDRDVDDVCEKLRTLDVILTNITIDPPAGGGSQMLRTMRIYNQACLDLLYLCSMDKLRVLGAAENILMAGGPKFFDIQIDEKLMKERFHWDEDKMDELLEVTKKSYDHWNDLWYVFNNFPTDLR
ncbi:hypothetical protein J6590_026066 [Homalodisca vitripennis]|uniref:Uncharacterized protein n=1 Tax=Homalodisca liturata TaxID=320908 RepID=A0A1B6HZ47_9HEMI|nr:hypothetical protein J6590_026066 [Homalodisca vitripennis]